MEIVYATQKGLQLLIFELHEMAGRHFFASLIFIKSRKKQIRVHS